RPGPDRPALTGPGIRRCARRRRSGGHLPSVQGRIPWVRPCRDHHRFLGKRVRSLCRRLRNPARPSNRRMRWGPARPRLAPPPPPTGIASPPPRDWRAGYLATRHVREAAAAGFAPLDQPLPPVPLTAHRAEDRWGAEAIGRAVGRLTALHVDRTSFGWRLTASAGKDERVEDSALVEAFDAIAEYGQSWPGQIQLSLPGPWTLVTALSL